MATSDNNENKSSDEIDVSRLTFSTIPLITDDVFEKIDIELHGAILLFNELIRSEDTSSWYFLDKVHEHYFPTTEKWKEYLQKISPNKPIDIHDIRSQIMNGKYCKNDEQRLLNDIGSVFTNAMIRYEEEEDDESNNDEDNDYYDEAQRILTKFQTLCSEMEKEKESKETKESTKSDGNESKQGDSEDSDNEILYGSTDNVFEIEDYYCASPWERLISEIEKQCMAWNIHKGSEQCAVEYRQQMKNQCVLSTNICISNSDYNYILEYHDYTDFIEEINVAKNNNKYKYFTRSMHEIISRERDPSIICSNSHEICAWFGISRFLLLLPGNSNIDYIDESECMFMCSTLSIAVFNIECALSYFVPFGDQWDMSFRGGLRFNRFNTTYVCKSQRSIPPICEYLDGIFKVFKRHLRLYYDESDAMLTMASSDYNPLYRIYGFCSFKYLYDPSTNILALLNHNWRDLMADDIISYGIRWGPTYSPLKSLSLQTIWTYFPEGAFIDNMAHSEYFVAQKQRNAVQNMVIGSLIKADVFDNLFRHWTDLDTKRLALFIAKSIGYSEFIQLSEVNDGDDRLLFYSDLCVLYHYSKDMSIVCGIENDETHFKHIINYSLASKSIPYPRLKTSQNCSLWLF